MEQYTSLVIITPAVDTAWVEALVPLLRRGAIPTVLLLDPVSFADPEPFDPSTGPFDRLRTGLRAGSAQDEQSRRGGADDLSVMRALLVDLGVVHYVITRDLLDQPEARPVQQEHRGRPVSGPAPAPVRRPREAGWKVLS